MQQRFEANTQEFTINDPKVGYVPAADTPTPRRASKRQVSENSGTAHAKPIGGRRIQAFMTRSPR
jgi:hypothetical protein